MKRAISTAVAISLMSGSAHAGLPVYDYWNHVVNKANLVVNEANLLVNEGIAISNAAQNVQLELIRKELHQGPKGTVKQFTWNIDNSTHNIDNSTKTLVDYNIKNYEIDNTFTWIINHGTGDEIIPIPREVGEKLELVRKGQATADFTAHYKSLDMVKDDELLGRYGDANAIEASRARKAANDALVEAIAHDETALAKEAEALKKLAEISAKAEGHGNQLQMANALSGSTINQLVKLRSMTLAAETARSAEMQAKADRDARAAAVGSHLRRGLQQAIDQTMAPVRNY